MAKLKHKLVQLISQKQIKTGRMITQAEVAKAAGVSKQTISNWMKSEEMDGIRSDTLTGLCRYFECDLPDVVYIDWQGNPPYPAESKDREKG